MDKEFFEEYFLRAMNNVYTHISLPPDPEPGAVYLDTDTGNLFIGSEENSLRYVDWVADTIESGPGNQDMNIQLQNESPDLKISRDQNSLEFKDGNFYFNGEKLLSNSQIGEAMKMLFKPEEENINNHDLTAGDI